jgi:transposase
VSRKSPYNVQLTAEEKAALESLARKYTAPYCVVIRARVILLAAKGLANEQIAACLSMGRQNVSKWRKRFFHKRLKGLDDELRTGRPRK